MKYSIAIHGGAGTINRENMSPEKESTYRNALEQALQAGVRVLEQGGSAADAVTASVVSLEDCPLFNAGKGSVFTADAKHEMDASIMLGHSLEAGAVSGVSLVRNPIVLARTIMEKSEHVFLSSAGAEQFAREQGLPFEPEVYFYDAFRFQQFEEAQKVGRVQLDHTEEGHKKFSTVGCVALDSKGNLAAATSTGGMTNKKYNRIGDSPIIGAGTYANNKTCAISCTGHGEYFIRSVVAYDISCLMEYGGYTLAEACEKVVMDKLVKIGGEGGLIAIDAAGNICLPFNSTGMYRAWKKAESKIEIEIYK